jgi:U2 small nuclear ribonucleoprotein A'
LFGAGLEDLNLKNNSIAQLALLKPLASCPKLVRLCLIGNPIFVAESYRLYVIHLIPQLKLLDFQKVKDEERRQSEALFEGEQGAALLKEIEAGAKGADKGDDEETNGSSSNGRGSHSNRSSRSTGPSKEEVARIKLAIANAKTLEEVNALEEQLKGGTWGK